jgi:hypothetical protein
MTQTHTPGPWQVNDAGLIYGQVTGDDDEAPFICDCCNSSFQYTAQKRANARLISAAPTMNGFIATIARMTQDGEEREDDAEPFIMENDDAVSTLNRLIEDAREIIKTTA